MDLFGFENLALAHESLRTLFSLLGRMKTGGHVKATPLSLGGKGVCWGSDSAENVERPKPVCDCLQLGPLRVSKTREPSLTLWERSGVRRIQPFNTDTPLQLRVFTLARALWVNLANHEILGDDNVSNINRVSLCYNPQGFAAWQPGKKGLKRKRTGLFDAATGLAKSVIGKQGSQPSCPTVPQRRSPHFRLRWCVHNKMGGRRGEGLDAVGFIGDSLAQGTDKSCIPCH